MSFSTPTASLFSAAHLAVAIAAIAAIATAPCALASDGALEIHQACVATGCFPGDTPGFPVEIVNGGSYNLTSNLQVPDENTTAVELLADEIHLDLGGFTISGVTDCGPSTGDPCTPAATFATGVDGQGSAGSTVSRGSIRGMGGRGVRTGLSSRLEDLKVSHNGRNGIELLGSGIVRNCITTRNGEMGLFILADALVYDSMANSNNTHGIFSSGRSTFRGNSASMNGGFGLVMGGASVAIGNTLVGNGSAGLSGTPASGYAQTTLNGNATGTPADQVSGSPAQLGLNLCASNPCP